MAGVLFALTAGAVGLLVVLLARAAAKYMEFRKLELAIPGPASLPLLGNALTLATMKRENMLPTLLGMINGRSELSRISLFNNLIVVASDPDDIAKIMKRKEFNNKSRFFYDFFGVVARNGLVQLSGPKWKQHRQVLQPALALDVIEPYMHVFTEEAEEYARGIPNQGAVDVHDALHRPLVRIFMRTAMTAENLGPDDEAVLADAMHLLDTALQSINTRSFSPWLWPDVVFNMTSLSRMLRRRLSAVQSYLDGNIMRRRQQREQMHECTDAASRRKQILLDKMIQSEHGFSDQDMMDEIVTFLSAATDTAVATLSFAFKMMSLRPDVQDRVYAEVAEVLGSGADKRAVDLSDLPRLQYLEQVIKETLRMLPTIPFVARQVSERTELAGHTVPANSTLVLNIHGVHHDPKHWPDPWHFDPDRFAPGANADRHPYSFLAFSAGPRNCVGGRYAMMAMKALFATVLRDHRIEPADDGVKDARDLKITFNLSARIVGGTWVKFRPRNAPAEPPLAG